MRHAESVFDDCHGNSTDACYFSLEPAMQDSYLSLGAHFQIDFALQSFSSLKFDKVYLSPLRRAVETAVWFCEASGNLENTEFILSPDLSNVLVDSDDVPIDIRSLIAEFAPQFTNGLDSLAFEQLIFPELWFLNNLDKTSKDALYTAIAAFNGFEYDSASEMIYSETGAPLMGFPLVGSVECPDCYAR